jgi:ADP-L-glycero-D-manno-heptose 6-epimerase
MILITGGDGFIGSHLIELLNSLHRIDIVVIEKNTNFTYLNNLSIDSVYSPEELYKVNPDIEHVFHLGAISSTTETDNKLLEYYNYNFSINLIDWCVTHKIPISYASSASVYGNMDVKKWNSDNRTFNPLNLYGRYKLLVDNYVNYNLFDIPIKGYRFFNVYGKNEGHKLKQASPFYTFKNDYLNTSKVTLFNDSENYYRDFIPVQVVTHTLLQLYNEHRITGVYDLGSGYPLSFYDVAKIVIGKSDIEDYVTYIDMPEHIKQHYQYYTCSNFELQNAINSLDPK